MELVELRAEAFRNLQAFRIKPGAGINVVFGENGAGKTSLLEAVHFLARAKSFRTAKGDKLIALGADRCWVFGVGGAEQAASRFGVERERGRTRVRRDGQDVHSLSEWAAHWPVEVVNSEAQRFVVDGPATRRSFLNWGVFHVEHDYGDHWQRFRRALEQCNAALRNGDARQAAAWEAGVAEAGEALDVRRAAFAQRLAAIAQPLFDAWLPDHQVTVRYRRGWRAEFALHDALAEGREAALRLGHVLHGPQRADLQLLSDGEDAQHRLSRGQQKIAVVALSLGKAKLIAEAAGMRPLLLVDDLPAELDARRRAQVLNALEAADAQVFVTCIEKETMSALEREPQWFHVEHGRVDSVI
ncbi:DNA replication/repair protein RecF [Ectothiorhodospiraceae bacterium WFHF3C12]|nr:DNA replication/repair protein RecF [Ectothiorhodospiraceae bacterium WFHF3C12]